MLKIIFQRIIGIAFISSICAISGCQSLPTIHTLYDDNADFGSYSTFSFHPELMPQGDEYDKISTCYIKTVIIAEMQSRGFRYAEEPDLWVNFNIYSKQKIRVISTPAPYSYYEFRYNYGVWGGYPPMETRIDQYTEGTLNIDVVDRRSKRLLWEGVAIGKLTKKNRENLEAKINEAVNLIFEKFPR
ncbi:MAG: hypothetical protein ACI88A_002215 [Paraglaciecola sp.]|jgi:hypothetical protein